MKVKVNGYDKQKGNLQELLEYIKEDIELAGATFDDITIYLHTKNRKTKKCTDLVSKSTRKELGYLISDKDITDKNTVRLATLPDEATGEVKAFIYETYK